jgi:uncharacterized membrane protein YhhN
MTAVFAAATALLLIPLLVGEAHRRPWRIWVKAGASAGFVATAVAAGAADSGYGRWVLAALVLGWVGDVALVPADRRWFLTGLVAFLLSHLAYAAAFLVLGVAALPAGAAAASAAVVAVAVARWLWPHLPAEMRGPVIAYIVVISAMVAAAWGARAGDARALVVAGAMAFYVSDLFVARDRFVDPGFVNRLLGLPLYYAAQVMLAISTASAV